MRCSCYIFLLFRLGDVLDGGFQVGFGLGGRSGPSCGLPSPDGPATGLVTALGIRAGPQRGQVHISPRAAQEAFL